MLTANFNTINSTFRKLLGNGMSYRVPPFQRDYSWTQGEWEDFWLDICGLFEEDGEPAHYMGYLVLQSDDSKTFTLIDGQQRITTVSIMILAALSHLTKLVNLNLDGTDNTKRKEQLQNAYIGYVDPVSLTAHPKLTLNRHNNKFYQTYLVPLDEPLPQRNLNVSENLLRKAFLWFKERINDYVGTTEESGKELARFIDSLVDKLFFTVTTVTDELNAFKVFETLNARGVRLSSTDLLKNHLFSIAYKNESHEAELAALEVRWEEIVGTLKAESFPDFLRIYWNSRNRFMRKTDLFKKISKMVTTKQQVFDLIRDLDRLSSIYVALQTPHEALWNKDEQRIIKQLHLFRICQPMSMLLASYVRFFEHDRAEFTRILNAVAIISFRYNVICNLQANDQERAYNDIALGISNGTLTTAADVIQKLHVIYPDDAMFKAAFSEKTFKTSNSNNKRIVRFILFQIERQMSGREFDFENDSYSIEHILPENPSEDWAHIEEAQQDQMVDRIGNLTLLEARWNREIGNADYTAKRDVYRQSAFQTTQWIADHYETWGVAKIESRQQALVSMASGIWKINFPE